MTTNFLIYNNLALFNIKLLLIAHRRCYRVSPFIVSCMWDHWHINYNFLCYRYTDPELSYLCVFLIKFREEKVISKNICILFFIFTCVCIIIDTLQSLYEYELLVGFFYFSWKIILSVSCREGQQWQQLSLFLNLGRSQFLPDFWRTVLWQ